MNLRSAYLSHCSRIVDILLISFLLRFHIHSVIIIPTTNNFKKDHELIVPMFYLIDWAINN